MSTDQHVTVLSILHIASSALLLVAAGIVFFVVGGGLLSGEQEAMLITGTVGTVIAGFFTLLALPGIIGGIGLLKRKEWARIVILIVGFLDLINFPLGTLLGVYTIWVLMRHEASDYFRAYVPA